MDPGEEMSLDLGGVGPDGHGEPFEGVDGLSQLQQMDALLGGSMLDESVGDPFAVPPA